MTGTGTAAVAGCVGGEAPPCTTAYHLVYSGDVTGTPFSDLTPPRDAVLSGYLDVPAQGFDAATNCYSGTLGLFELRVHRGAKTVLAFAESVSGTYCTHGGGGSFTGTYTVDSSDTRDPYFRDAVGSGVISLTDSLDLAGANAGVFSRDDSGTITTRR